MKSLMAVLEGEGPIWLRGVVLLGAPTVISLGLVWWLTMNLIPRQLEVQTSHLLELERAIESHEASRELASDRFTNFLYASCLNEADTNSAKLARCRAAARDERVGP